MNRKTALCVVLMIVLVLSLAVIGSACKDETATGTTGEAASTGGSSPPQGTGGPSSSSTAAVTLQPTASVNPSAAAEPLHIQYIHYVHQLMKNSDQLADGGLTVQARFFYSFAGASTSALRFTLDQLLTLKGASLSSATADAGMAAGSLQDWDTIAAISFACPFPYYFESLVWQFRGEQDKAETCFSCAWINPYFPRKGVDFTYLKEYPADKLEALRAEVVSLENSIYGTYGGGTSSIERNPMNFSDQYLRTLAEESLKQYPDNYNRAMTFYATALQVNQFEAKNFTALAILALYAEDLDTAFDCVNEGLWIDKDNLALNKLAQALQQAGKQVS